MNAERFDTLARAMIAPGSRRRLLAGLLGGLVVARGAPTVAAAGRSCATNFDCPGQQICAFNEAAQRTECAAHYGCGHGQGRICKGEFEFTCCTGEFPCCTYAGEEDGLSAIFATCCPKAYTCDPTAGCVPAA